MVHPTSSLASFGDLIVVPFNSPFVIPNVTFEFASPTKTPTSSLLRWASNGCTGTISDTLKQAFNAAFVYFPSALQSEFQAPKMGQIGFSMSIMIETPLCSPFPSSLTVIVLLVTEAFFLNSV